LVVEVCPLLGALEAGSMLAVPPDFLMAVLLA